MAELRFSSGGGGPTLPVNVASGGTGVTSITASRALVSNADSTIIASATTATELSYVNGVTSAIQTQLNAKRSTASGKVVTDFQVSSLSAAFTTAANTNYQDTGLTVTVTVGATTDLVEFTLSAFGSMNAGSDATQISYVLDAAAEVMIFSFSGVAGRQNLGHTHILTGLSAGSHTIKIQAKTTNAGNFFIMQYHAADNEVPKLFAKVFG